MKRNGRSPRPQKFDGAALRIEMGPYSVACVLRRWYGYTQQKLAALCGLTQADVCEMEKRKPYGRIDKYKRLADFYQVSLEALVKNDFRAILPGTLRKPEVVYMEVPNSQEARLGRAGEEWALQLERERLMGEYPALADLVQPYFKMKVGAPGFDILTFDENGKPTCMEVKTSEGDNTTFMISPHEYQAAQKLSEAGMKYVIRVISGWGTENRTYTDIDYRSLCEGYRIVPPYYRCAPKAKRPEKVCGLTHFRLQNGMTQGELAERLGITASEVCSYETGTLRPPVALYIRASEILGATIDQLLDAYECKAY